ncbi:CocE/NonD family hydrolase [Neptunicoccus cionae]|uniref:Hydrolase n=1 Tax=Neptunicoccus cionae TaxID=2035344 RepID=A0A916QSC2_9RHOB|nr:CocE/NonD family hydrolase [Amylibacter cionae]GGA09785.1 hydrolase [Amylibacter cionae]
MLKSLLIRLAALLCVIGAALVFTEQGRAVLRPVKQMLDFRAFAAELPVATKVKEHQVAMPDGVTLATDVYLPEGGAAQKPVVLVRLPYGKRVYGEALHWVRLFSANDYAVVVQDMRGRYGSGGVFAPYPNERGDGVATLDWILAQEWAQPVVGTIGCSALGETQVLLAAERHPAHRAMIPMGAGGAIGTAQGAYGFYGFFEGGILNLASGFGWFQGQGGKTGDLMQAPPLDYTEALKTLPVIGAVARYRADATDFEELLRGVDDPEIHNTWGYISDRDRFDVPTLMVDTWYDYGIGFSFQLLDMIRKGNPESRFLIAPATHCDMAGPLSSGAVGDVPVNPQQKVDLDGIYLSFMNAHLKGQAEAPQPTFQSYVLNRDDWLGSSIWPPRAAERKRFYLRGKALSEMPSSATDTRIFHSDPSNPVPTIGGAICCTGDPESRAGPLDQSPLESRDDLLIYTGESLTQPLDIAGPLRAVLHVSTDVRDTDLVVRLTDVSPDGKSVLIQEGALRLRYRNGFDTPELMQTDQIYRAEVSLRHIAYRLKSGHQLRLHVAGSSFPRLARHMNTGGDPYRESDPQIARITLHSGAGGESFVDLFTLPAP